MPAALAASMMRAIASSTAASDSSNSSAQISESRSTPSISWVRSLDCRSRRRRCPAPAYSGMPVDDRRHLGHHPAVQSALRAQRAGVDQRRGRPRAPSAVRTNGIMRCRFGCLVAHAREDVELEPEQVGLADVAVAAAVADHRVVLDRLERVTALESAELVAAEVGRPVHDRSRGEARGDATQRCRHRVDERLLLAAREQVTAGADPVQRVGEHELGSQQADTVDVRAPRRVRRDPASRGSRIAWVAVASACARWPRTRLRSESPTCWSVRLGGPACNLPVGAVDGDQVPSRSRRSRSGRRRCRARRARG